MKENIKIFEGFAGYGGASFGFKRLKENLPNINYDVVGYSEFDKFASDLYDANHKDKNGNNIKNWGDITKINPYDLPDFDMFTGGFPCQPFSSAGLQLGDKDIYGRGNMLYQIIRICKVKKPKYLLLENVKGFTHKKFVYMHNYLNEELCKMGYGENPIREIVLNSKYFGVPQNRERLWIFAKLGGLPNNFSMNPKTKSDGKLSEFLDMYPDKKLYLNDEQIENLKVTKGIKSFVVNEPLCFDVYNRKIKTDGYCPTLTDPRHGSLRLIEPSINGKEILRKLSVYEQFRLMGFRISSDLKDCEINFNNQSYSQLSTRAANGWDINLVGILLTHIFKQLDI
jgi:DNA (cytosine-5)-methyltransferase 1